jgi:diacylglycerol kinase (ATP)
MKVAPDASPEDGLLDVIVVGDISKLGLFRAFPSIYRGTHLSHPALAHRRGRRVEIESDADEMWLEGDGESFGTPPITLELLPAALRVFGLSAAAPLGADE